MMVEPDDEALNWSEPADPTHLGAAADSTFGTGTDAGTDPGGGKAVDGTGQVGSALLIVYGVFAGIYLLFTIGWMVSALRNNGGVESVFGDFMYRLGEFLAMAASALWLLATFLLTKNKRAVIRLLWLLIGVIVLVPWPFVLGA